MQRKHTKQKRVHASQHSQIGAEFFRRNFHDQIPSATHLRRSDKSPHEAIVPRGIMANDGDTKQEDGEKEASDTDEKGGVNRRAFASFSMAHALSMVRQRQLEQQRAQQEQESVLEEERKEKARAKRRRRRQNQKLARAKAKAETNDCQLDDEQSEVSNEDSCDKSADVSDDKGTNHHDDLPAAQDDVVSVSSDLPPKKRLKLASGPTIAESSSIAPASERAQNEANPSERLASINAIKLRSLVPRAVMLKKTT